MAVPKKKVSRARRGNRRSHDTIILRTIVECPNCGAEKLPHQVCSSCGFYNKRKIISLTKSTEDKQA